MKIIKTLIREEEIQKKIKDLAEKLNSLYCNEEVVLICVLKGAVMFAADLSKRLTMPLNLEFIRLSSYGESHVSSGKVQALDLMLPDLDNKNVLIIEDIIDTGRTAKFLIDYINQKYKVKSLKFCSLLDKKCKRAVDIDVDYSLFDIDDKFVVGYGLDDAEKYRNLPYIGYIE